MERHSQRGVETSHAAARRETRHKSIIRYANGKLLRAYLTLSEATSLQTGEIETIVAVTPEGRAVHVRPTEIKAIFIVKSFEGSRNYSEFKVFPSRPTGKGVWMRVRFQDGETLEGVAPNNLDTFSSAIFSMSPPDPSSNNQIVLVSKRFLKEMHVLGLASD